MAMSAASAWAGGGVPRQMKFSIDGCGDARDVRVTVRVSRRRSVRLLWLGALQVQGWGAAASRRIRDRSGAVARHVWPIGNGHPRLTGTLSKGGHDGRRHGQADFEIH